VDWGELMATYNIDLFKEDGTHSAIVRTELPNLCAAVHQVEGWLREPLCHAEIWAEYQGVRIVQRIGYTKSARSLPSAKTPAVQESREGARALFGRRASQAA
jgi:hypothetical protein